MLLRCAWAALGKAAIKPPESCRPIARTAVIEMAPGAVVVADRPGMGTGFPQQASDIHPKGHAEGGGGRGLIAPGYAPAGAMIAR